MNPKKRGHIPYTTVIPITVYEPETLLGFTSSSRYIDSAAVADSSMGAIEIQGAADLDALVSYYASSPEEMDEIRPTVASFVAGIQSAYSADGQSFMFMLFPVSHVNHSPSPNIRENRKGDLWFVQSIADIKAGDEILSDYTVFYFSDEVREWHKRHNLMDCTTFAESLKA